MNKKKIINDPIYGFVHISSELMHDVIQHPIFQRLRRIKQLGLASYTYPGAMHTRFQHAIGASHLMQEALNVLRAKNIEITDDEYQAVLITILLHDLGHGPFSHTLEHSFFANISHETISMYLMKQLNNEFSGQLSKSIDIFIGKYHKKFLHQLVSSQLDMDRLDYLRRDSYYTGVIEGVVGSDRIIKMLNVHNNELVVEEKGIYSIENFLIARRLMYWQVYLHKTVIAAEQMLIKAIQRAKELHKQNTNIFLTPALSFFFENNINNEKLLNTDINGISPLQAFIKLDDYDVISCIKEWQYCNDRILSTLSKSLINRQLHKCKIQISPFNNDEIYNIRNLVKKKYDFSDNELNYFVTTNTISNNAYSKNSGEQINIINKSKDIKDVALASDISNLSTLSRIVAKHFVCHPKINF